MMRGKVALLATLIVAVAAPAEPVAAVPAAPLLTSPDDGATLDSFGPTLTWSNPGGATQYQIQVTPANNDGPGIDLYAGVIGNSYSVQPAPRWYGLLPDMTYAWRVRVSDAATAAPLTDASWGPWAERTFRTPKVASDTIAPATPATGDVVLSRTPTLQWTDSRRDVFYYEVQLSKDREFVTDPRTATAAVYWELRHGGLTDPLRSYAVPPGAPLEDNITYHWRVRPRVQGDGQPLPWSATSSFQTNTTAAGPLVRVERISHGLTAPDGQTCTIEGAGNSFPSTPTLTGLHLAIKHTGAGTIVRNWYWNNRPYLVFTTAIESGQTCLTGSFGPPGGGPDAGIPIAPGDYRLEIWHAGVRGALTEFGITPAKELAIGPVTLGTKLEDTRSCRLSGTGTSFPRAVKTLWSRFNFVGSGSFSANIWRGSTSIARLPTVELSPAVSFGCIDDFPYTPPEGFMAGAHRFDVLIDGRVVQSVPFTIS